MADEIYPLHMAATYYNQQALYGEIDEVAEWCLGLVCGYYDARDLRFGGRSTSNIDTPMKKTGYWVGYELYQNRRKSYEYREALRNI